MDYGGDFRNSLTYSQDSMPLSDSATDTVSPASNPPQDDLFALIDLAAPNPPNDDSYVQKLEDPALSSKAFAEDLAGLQPTPMDMSKLTFSKKNSTGAASLLPLQTRSLRRNKRGGNRFDELSHNRCSTPESIASEMDPYTQWYQLMQKYYKRFYPGYEFGSSTASSLTHRAQRHVPISAVPLTQTTPQAVNQQQMQQHPQPPFNFPGWPPMSVQGRSRVPGGQMQMPGFGQVSDYAAYYYQYYMGAWAAANGWPVSTDGEPGRVELLDISQLASDVVAEVTNRLSAVSMTSRGNKTAARHQQHFPNSYTASDGYLASSTNDDLDSRIGEDDLIDEEEEEEYIGLVNAWDRTDHILYPGPLCQGTTLKHDVQAFLRGKVEDIQDRMPVVHPGDVVNLLMGSDSSRLIYDYPTSNTISSVAPFPTLANRVTRQSSFNIPQISAMGGGSGGLYLDSNSGRESPRVTLTHSASMGGFQQQPGSGRTSVAGSSTGGMSISRMMRKGLLAEYGSAQEKEAAALQRFRELLMHGHSLKALDQACQTQLWGHAFALAMRLGPGPLDRVMEKFLSRAVNPADPLLTLYQLTAGEIPRSVDQLAYAGGADTGDWRPHLAMLLSAPEGHGDLARESLERMGESLLARRLLFAAHLCFLLASSYSDQGTATTPRLHSRIWLLGVAAPTSKSSEESSGRFVMTTEVERASTEAIQLTEVYEFALALATRNKHFFLPNFLPFKFAYCLRLIDAGLIETAFRYLEVLSDSISTLLEQEVEESCTSPIDLRALFLIASQCLRLSERLRHHPEVGSFEMEGDSHSNVFRGGFTSPCPRWMERLRNVFERISSVLGLPNSDRPYVDPLRVSSSQEPPAQQQQQDQGPPQQNQVSQPAQVRTIVASTVQQQQPSYQQPLSRNSKQPEQQQQQQPQLQRQQDSPKPMNQPPQQQQTFHQSPVHQVQQQPKQALASQNQHLSGPQYQSTVHDNGPSPSQPSSPTFYQEQQRRMSHEARNAPPTPQQSQQNQFQDQPLAPILPPASPTMRVENHQTHQKSPVGASKNNLGFFVPTFNPSADSTKESAANVEAPTTASGYDYFADLAASQDFFSSFSQQPISRSRTVSMASSQDDSIPHPSSPSPVSPQVPQVSAQIQRKSSRNVPQPPANSSGSFLRDNRTRNTQINTRTNHAAPFTTAPSQPPVSVDNRRKANGQPQQSQQQSQAEKQEEEKKEDNNGGQSGKSGWLSGFFGRIKGAQEVYLPDDSNPTIVWDEATGRWRDKLGGDQEVDAPPPPPQMSAVPAMPQNNTPMGHPGAPPTSNPVPLHVLAGGSSGSGSGGATTRSRYVNVLAKQGVSIGPKAGELKGEKSSHSPFHPPPPPCSSNIS
ncbi:unnamed protein product [Hymenolepis diminuta]|uniref:Sec16_C domain-containing protein n=1 Tax=Hymenolepis diminuta TaxID=6216 RepID=A0A158QFX8_HYMDI|nr:unnamed protein product [Hymenolepis diminuta]